VNTPARRPYPQYNGIFVSDSHGWLRYDSLQVKAERRAAKGLYLLGAYTWSKALSNGLRQEITGDPGLDLYPILPSDADKGLAGTDLRHNFTMSALYSLPFGKGQRWLSGMGAIPEAIFGGWDVNGIALLHSGFALGYSTASNQSGTGLGNRPNQICGGQLSSGQTANKWFDTSCFVAPASGLIGNSSRTPGVYGPGQVNFDTSLYKNFRVTETTKLQFRSEFFNIFNHTQLAIPNTVVGNAAFGRILATAHSSRQIQFALKFVF
jgi:hypothetical protein